MRKVLHRLAGAPDATGEGGARNETAPRALNGTRRRGRLPVSCRTQNLTQRFGVKGFIPPERLMALAEERTEGMIAAYEHLSLRATSFGQHLKLLAMLVRSAYMQGINDAIDATVRELNVRRRAAGGAGEVSE